MTIDKRKLYILSSVLVPAFLLVCFIGNPVTRRRDNCGECEAACYRIPDETNKEERRYKYRTQYI